MATIFKTDGTVTEIKPKKRIFSLEELQSVVEGHIEFIGLRKGRSMFINEEGKLERLPYNEKATQIFQMELGITDDFIVGNAIICEKGEVE